MSSNGTAGPHPNGAMRGGARRVVVLATAAVAAGLVVTHIVRRLMSLVFTTSCGNTNRRGTMSHTGEIWGWCDTIWCLSVRGTGDGTYGSADVEGAACRRVGGYGSLLCLIVVCVITAAVVTWIWWRTLNSRRTAGEGALISASGTGHRIDERAFKRFKIIEELFLTEDSYIADLYIICTCFVEPLEKILKPKHFQGLFCNITSLVRVNSKLLAQLKKSFQEVKENQNFIPPIGEAFLSVKQDMTREYTQYLCGQSTSQHTLEKIQSKPKFSKVLQEICSRPECRKLQLQAFLVKPLQRLTKYPLMLKSLLEVLPEPPKNPASASCDRYCSLSAALTALQFLNTRANAFVKSSEVVKRIADMVDKSNYKLVSSVLMPPSLPQTVNCMPPLLMDGTIALQTSNLAEPKEAYLAVTQSHFLCVMPKKIVLQTKRDLLSSEKIRIQVTDTPGTLSFQVRISPEPSALNIQRQSQSPSPSPSPSPSLSPSSPRFPLRNSTPDQQLQAHPSEIPHAPGTPRHPHPLICDGAIAIASVMPPAPATPPPTPPPPSPQQQPHHISRLITRATTPDTPLVFLCSSDAVKSKWLAALSS